MSEGDRYNIWSTDSYAMDISVCDIIDTPENERIIAFTQGGDWPIFICVITNDIKISVHTPVELSEDEITVKSKGIINEIQRVGKDINSQYNASGKVQNRELSL